MQAAIPCTISRRARPDCRSCDTTCQRTRLFIATATVNVVLMNENHALCATPEWADHIHHEVLGSLLTEIDLGDEMLEVGAGPGAARADLPGLGAWRLTKSSFRLTTSPR